MKKGMGYVLIKCAVDKIESVYHSLKNIPEVKDIYSVDGDYDIIVKVETDDVSRITSAVLKVRKIPGITHTKTLTVVDLE